MKREVAQLVVVSAAVAYLFYYLLSHGGGVLGNIAVSAVSMYIINEWAQVFYRLGLRSGRTPSRAEGDR
jgi:hypothetical protein